MVSYLPAHTHYIEAFAGGLSLLFAKRPSTIETINDLDRRLITFWTMLRDKPEELIRACAYTPYAREEFFKAREVPEDEEPLEVARCLFVRLTQGRMAKPNGRGTWRHPLSNVRSPADEYAEFVNRLERAAARLRSVYIECMPATQLLEHYGKHSDILFYLDPPYVYDTRTSSTRGFYVHEMTDEDHTELAEAAHTVKGPVVVSGYPSTLYKRLYKDWFTVELPYWTVQGNGTRQPRMEVLWMNRQPQGQQALFSLDIEEGNE